MVDFIEREPRTIAAEVKNTYEQALGKTLLPAQPEQLLINGASYREILLRLQIQHAAEQSLVNFADGDRLNELGALVGVERLQPAKARVTLRFTRTNSASGLLVPAGFRVAGPGNQIWYETLENLEITGESGEVNAQAIATGTQFNGLALGSIDRLVDRLSGVIVENVTVPTGGSNIESDGRLRRRIKLAPNQFSVAGSKGAYEFFTLSVDPSIIDVAAVNGGPVQVEIYPLTAGGLPSSDILSAVQNALSDERIRPLTDIVRVFSPTERPYTIRAEIVVESTANVTVEQLTQAAESYAWSQRTNLGEDVVRSQIISALSLPGVYRVNLLEPAEDIITSAKEWANAQIIDVQVVGDE